MSRKRTDFDASDLVRRYVAGDAANALAKSFGLTRATVGRVVTEAGVELRGRSAAETEKWAQMSTDRRSHQVRAAHSAVKGMTRTQEDLARRALGKQQAAKASPSEIALRDMLADRGIITVQQQAVGPYNCDLGAFPVAVEVFGGNWHWYGRHLERTPNRLRYLLDAGWSVLMVQIWPGGGWCLTSEVADYVASYVEEARRHPTRQREYRVIRGAGELLASGRADDDELSIVTAFTNRRDPVTGRYERVARDAVGM